MIELENQTPGVVPGTRTNWNVILAFALVAVTTQLLWVTFTPITTQSAQLLGVSENDIGWLSEVFPLIYVLLAIPFGLLTDKWFRPSVVVGTLLTVAGGVLRLDGHFPLILLGQVITSIGQPLILNAINKMALHYATRKRQTVAISLCSASLFLGILLAMLSGPLILTSYSLSGLLWTQALFSLLTGVWLLTALYLSGSQVPLTHSLDEQKQTRKSGQAEQHSLAGESGSLTTGTGGRKRSVGLRHVWANRNIRTLCYLLFVGFGLFIALTTWLQALLAAKHITDLEVGIALALMTAAGMVGAAVIPDWAIRQSRAKRMILASLVASIATCLYVLVGIPFWVMTVLLMVTGFLLLADLPIVLTTAELISSPEEAGTVTALLMLFGNAGGIVLALLVQVFLFSSVVAIAVLILAALAAIPFASRFPGRG